MKKFYSDLSTSHLKPETMQLLLRTASGDCIGMGWPAMTIASYEQGVFITVPYDLTDDQMDALPSDLEEVFSHVRLGNSELVRFDADGHIDPDLGTFDWE